MTEKPYGSGQPLFTMQNEQVATTRIRTLTLVTGGLSLSDPAEEAADLRPRGSLYNRVLNTRILNETSLREATGWRRFLYQRLPLSVSQVIEAYVKRRDYDVIISWGEKPALLFAFLLKATGRKFPHISMTSWISKPKKALAFRILQSHITTMVFWSRIQRDFAINRLGVAPEKTRLINWLVDQKFFRPTECETDMICSAGREMRDYSTLIEAMRGLDIKCHIAVSLRGKLFKTIKRVYEERSMPPNLTVSNLSPTELREMYSRSRFIVVPLLETDTDNGITVMLEAMSMGKAVICSRTAGRPEAVIEGKTGLLVPPGDSKALREAILYLWNHPEIAEEMGREARKQVEDKFTLDEFVASMKSIAEETVALSSGSTIRRN